MAQQTNAHRDDSNYPEVVHPSHNGFSVYNSSYEYYLPQDSPAPEYIPQRSPAPEYSSYRESRQLSSPSPRLSANSPPPLTTSFGHSPSSSDAGWQVRTPPIQYSEFHSPQPETVPQVDEKEYYNKNGTIASVANASSLNYQNTVSRKPVPQAYTTPVPLADEQPPKKKPFYKRPLGLLIIGAIIVLIAIAVALGVVFGTKKHNTAPTPSPNTNSTPANNPIVINGDPNVAVGGYLSPTYFSKSGAFNGSGIAIAGANPGVDETAYVFYQDFQGNIVYKLMKTDGSFTGVLGQVNDPSSNPLNGTPISIVNTNSANKTIVYHFFYLDENYLVNERLLQAATAGSTGSVIPVWQDGPLTSRKIKAMKADTIGMQACLWNNYYANPGYNSSNVYATDGIQFWVATDETTFAQYSWTNGTSSWNFDQTWPGMDAHAGVGCQTWESWMTEYIFFVDQNQDIAMYWRDNNKTAPSTTAHPTLKWNKIQNISITDVQKSSSLGFTTYMIYQHSDTSIRGANISWAAENTSIATVDATGAQDIFVINDLTTNNATAAVRGTHMTLTALKTPSGGAELQVFFQQLGNDIVQYTRDMVKVNGLWQKGANVI